MRRSVFLPGRACCRWGGPGWENANCSRRLFGDLGHCIHPVRLISLRSEHSPDCLPTALPNHPRSPNVSQFVFPQLVPIPPTSRSVCGRIHFLQPGESIPGFFLLKRKNRTLQKREYCAAQERVYMGRGREKFAFFQGAPPHTQNSGFFP